MSEPLVAIKAKCEQYWNESRINPVEVHAILEFIHIRSVDAAKEIARLKADNVRLVDQLHDQGTGRASYLKGMERAAKMLDGPHTQHLADAIRADIKTDSTDWIRASREGSASRPSTEDSDV